MAEQYAYSTDRPEVLAAWRSASEARQEFGRRLAADCETLGGNTGALMNRGVWGRDRIVGLQPDGSGAVPDGWRAVRGRLEPRRGKPGEAARQWLADHQPPDVRHTLAEHGLPRHSTMPGGPAMTYRLISPVLFELDGTLWVCYEGEPGDALMSGERLDESIWTLRRLSEFHAAREELEARHGG